MVIEARLAGRWERGRRRVRRVELSRNGVATNLIVESSNKCLQGQSDCFERQGAVNRCFLDRGHELDDEMGHTKDHGEELKSG